MAIQKDSNRRFIEYTDFRGGESGTIASRLAPANSFTGLNVMPFRDGSIGPRSGLFAVTPTGQANGVISCLGITSGAGSSEFWYVQGTNVYRFAASGARSAAYTGSTIAAHTLACDWVPINGNTQAYLLVPGDRAYLLDHTTGVKTVLTGSPTGRAICLHGTRLFIGGPTSQPNRLYYSADADVNSWVDHIDLPGDPAVGIRGLYNMRDVLIIVRASGEIWALTGTVGTNEVLRRVTSPESAGGIFQPWRGDVDYNNELWMVGMHSTAPERFTGGRFDAVEYLGAENVSVDTPPGAWSSSMLQTDVIPPEYATVGLSQKSLGFFGNNRALLRRDGMWSKHAFGQQVVGMAYDASFGEPILTDGGAAGAVPNFWVWNTVDDRPPMKSSGLKARDSIGDGSDTAQAASFVLPEWWDKDGRRVTIHGVGISYRKWLTGVAATNHFDVHVRSLYRYNAGSANAVDQSFDEASASGTVLGQREHQWFGFEPLPGEGFQLVFDNLRGVSIERIVVEVVYSEGTAI